MLLMMLTIFSNFGAIQTKLCNRLGLEKATKLVSCYPELYGGAELDWWLSEHFCGFV